MDIELDLSVCIVARNRMDALRNLLRSIYDTADHVAFEAIVVDNRSTDDTVALLDREFPAVLLYENSQPEPGAKAKNRALTLARGRYVSFWAPDLEFAPECLLRLLRFMDDNPAVGIAAPMLTLDNGSPAPTARTDPTLFSLLRRLLSRSRQPHPIASPPPANAPLEVDWCSGEALVVRREAVAEIGMFDEHFIQAYDDAEYCLRARRHGWHVFYVPAAEVRRRPARSILTKPDPQAAAPADMLRILLNKWFGRRTGK